LLIEMPGRLPSDCGVEPGAGELDRFHQAMCAAERAQQIDDAEKVGD
jgi:hypothetical protein